MSDKEILAKTVYLEARGEEPEGWRGVAFVIKTRARLNRIYWGGSSVRDVCLKPGQFECWNAGQNQAIANTDLFNKIKRVTDAIYDGDDYDDPTNGSDHYNNPSKEGYPEWTKNCRRTVKIGAHQFYKGNH